MEVVAFLFVFMVTRPYRLCGPLLSPSFDFFTDLYLFHFNWLFSDNFLNFLTT